MNLLTDGFREDPEYRQLIKILEQDFRIRPLPILASGLCEGASDAFLISVLQDSQAFRNGTALVLCREEKDCVKLCTLAERFGIRAGFYMARDLTFYHMTASHEYEQERLRVLSGLLHHGYDVIFTTPDAALGFTVPPSRLQDSILSISSDSHPDTTKLASDLTKAGYVRTDLVDSPGQFAVRGGIVDIFPPYGTFLDSDGEIQTGAIPLRIELFGDEIDRMGLFEPDTQRLTQSVVSAEFPPARELLPNKETLEELGRVIGERLRSLDDDGARDELLRERSAVENARTSGSELPFLDKYMSLVYPEKTCLLDYFPEKTLVLLRNTNAVEERLKASLFHLSETVTGLLENGTVIAKYAEYSHGEERLKAFFSENAVLHVDSLASHVSDEKLAGLFGFRTRQTVNYSDNEDLFAEDLSSFVQSGYRTVVLAENAQAGKTLSEKIENWGFSLTDPQIPFEKMPPGSVCVLCKDPMQGYELLVPHIAILSVDPRAKSAGLTYSGKSILRKKKKKNTKSILSYAELEEGDFVVHEDYGIGQYTGIETLTCDGVTKDYISIRYAGTDKLFLPVEKLDKVSKYIGAHSDDGLVKLSKMGSDAWQKSKTRTKGAVREMAKDLIRLYAERMRRPGHAFPADDNNQKTFEEAFEYEETESQLTAAAEIKEDMARPVPMDRLLCGDVGYGKTEVALRAAYKAVMGGKQVAVLVPTTLLSLQHYQTFVSRMRSFAVNVEMISRFRSPKQQTEILRRLERGDVDVLIGTHRLLSSDVKFHDLGLVIVDEEQRFGVAQKEKLKQISAGVDVLSLSATPIPRTLNMAMGGIRDISILDDAPVDRLPVQTYVLEEDPLILEEAIRRELRRGGQVFYLHNDVDSIYTVAAKVSEAIPEARVTVGHGKMEKEELERIWEEMLNGEIDVLVCTTIIETGVDVPNANTLIVSNAHRLGLSQLHQIRGRVGRSSRRAYAYFTYPPYKALTDIARKRLEAVREYAEFGAGFKIALRDMEIRGAGNLLGAEQHGHLDAVGYDLYIKLLNQAVLEEKGEATEPAVESTVSLDFDAFLPEKYVPFPAQRMALYKKIALIASEEDLSDVTDELVDRFGDPPPATRNLLRIALIHSMASSAKILKVLQNGKEIHIYPKELDVDRWSAVSDKTPGLRILVSGDPHLCLRVDSKQKVLDVLQKCMEIYLSAAPVASEKG